MAKLVALLLALSALVAFAYAETTIVTTTIEDDNPTSQRQCSRQLQQQRLNQCQRYLHQVTQSPYENPSRQGRQEFQQCCQELQNIDEQCQCAAVQQVFRDVVQRQQQQQGQQGGRFGAQQIRQLKQMAQNIPNQCNPQMRQQRQCQIGTIIITTLTEDDTEETYDVNRRIPHRGSQQCRQTVQRRFNQCQRYISQELQSGSPRTLLMSINRQGQQQPQELNQCCNELENIQPECHCEAIQEVYRQAKQEQQQQQGQQGRWQQGGRRGVEQEVRQVVENIRNQCNLQVHQCRIPSSMF